MGVTALTRPMFYPGPPDVLRRPARWSTAEWNALAFLGVSTIACMRSSSLPVLRRPARCSTLGRPMSYSKPQTAILEDTEVPPKAGPRGFTQLKSKTTLGAVFFFVIYVCRILTKVKSNGGNPNQTKTKTARMGAFFFVIYIPWMIHLVKLNGGRPNQFKAKTSRLGAFFFMMYFARVKYQVKLKWDIKEDSKAKSVKSEVQLEDKNILSCRYRSWSKKKVGFDRNDFLYFT